MRQTHLAGDKLFVDFAGQTLAVIDPASGEVPDACRRWLAAWEAQMNAAWQASAMQGISTDLLSLA